MSARNRVIVTLIALMALWIPTASAQTSTPEEPQADETTTADAGAEEVTKPSSEDRKQQP